MILGDHFYQMSNAIFFYDLTPTEFMVYSYLVRCAGEKEICWPSIHRIAVNCNCSENIARKAVASLAKQGFIRKVATYEDCQDGHSRQTNNTTDGSRKGVQAGLHTTPTVRAFVTTCALHGSDMGHGYVR